LPCMGKALSCRWPLTFSQVSPSQNCLVNIVVKQVAVILCISYYTVEKNMNHSLRAETLFFFSWNEVRLSPLGMSATNWPIVPAPYDRWLWSIWWNENWQGKLKYSEVSCPCATLCTTNPTWMIMEHLVEWKLARKTEVLWGILPMCHFVHHKSHMTWPGIEPGPPWWEAGN
jgi:hypothetical protein